MLAAMSLGTGQQHEVETRVVFATSLAQLRREIEDRLRGVAPERIVAVNYAAFSGYSPTTTR